MDPVDYDKYWIATSKNQIKVCMKERPSDEALAAARASGNMKEVARLEYLREYCDSLIEGAHDIIDSAEKSLIEQELLNKIAAADRAWKTAGPSHQKLKTGQDRQTEDGYGWITIGIPVALILMVLLQRLFG